ncbi:MAG: hypothetical protein AAGA31_03660 [Bacteroidota bacterium]
MTETDTNATEGNAQYGSLAEVWPFEVAAENLIFLIRFYGPNAERDTLRNLVLL